MVADAPSDTNAGPPRARVFICYARTDREIADRLFAALEARGFEPRIDRHPAALEGWSKQIETRIAPFEDWWEEIQRLIAQADTVLFILSPESVRVQLARRNLPSQHRSTSALHRFCTAA